MALRVWCDFVCVGVVGVGALVVGQSKIESEFPPSVRLTPATFPQGGRLFWGSCFAVAGLGGEVVGSLYSRVSSPLPSGSRLPPSPKGDGFFGAPALQSLGWVARLWAVYIRE